MSWNFMWCCRAEEDRGMSGLDASVGCLLQKPFKCNCKQHYCCVLDQFVRYSFSLKRDMSDYRGKIQCTQPGYFCKTMENQLCYKKILLEIKCPLFSKPSSISYQFGLLNHAVFVVVYSRCQAREHFSFMATKDLKHTSRDSFSRKILVTR